jgi:hypothetical protein
MASVEGSAEVEPASGGPTVAALAAQDRSPVAVTQNEPAVVVLGVRLIRSFPHRNIRRVTVKLQRGQLNELTEPELKRLVADAAAKDTSLPPPFRTYAYDTLKIEHVAHGAKTSDPVINCENDEQLLLLADGRSVAQWGVKHETDLSFFKKSDYEAYKANPTLLW